ncbi:MAG: GNAT family N-acetyltransferase [Chloroflexia bacterium]|nr:GNAT family N-acetyltransferase [Chloroflexia bacterium]MDQ3613924.1 GNAT family N-acetyltransferase [Chloroflexota bacterium]
MVYLHRATLEDLIGDALTKEDAGKHAEAFNLDWIAQEGEAAYTRMLGDERHVVTLAEVDGRAVGYLSGAVRDPSTWRTARMAEIFALYVIPEYRSQGIGERLVRSFLRWARDQGAERIVVAAFAANEAALRFYRRVGFAPFEVMLEQPVERQDGAR